MLNTRIAVIGSGISGLSSAWYLSQKFKIDIYEKNDYYGGHSNTQIVETDKNNIPIDTGFIVFNELNYPNLCNFFKQLKVPSFTSNMSFSVSMNEGKLEYSGDSISSIFAQKQNLLNFKFLKMLYEIVKFYKNAEKDREYFKNKTIDEYLTKLKYSNYFKMYHLYPMAASIWSSPISQIKNYPFDKFVNFFSNHGLLRIFNRPAWQTVSGGSKEYVKKVLSNPKIRAFKNSKSTIYRTTDGMWELKFKNKKRKYNHVVIAAHSDEVKEIIKSKEKKNLTFFSDITYSKNLVFLHSDCNLMPKNKKVWASWNYIENKKEISVSYWMNLLQNLATTQNFFVTLNPSRKPAKNKTYKKIIYEHPVYNFKTFSLQRKINSIQGKNNLWFCGAYLGYGFHEDGIKSGKNVSKNLLKLILNERN